MSVKVAATRPHGANGFAGVRIAIIGLPRALFLLFPALSGVCAAPLRLLSGHLHDDEPEAEGTSLWVLYVASVLLVLLGGAFAGLTIAYDQFLPFLLLLLLLPPFALYLLYQR
jgi:hypothetical protein